MTPSERFFLNKKLNVGIVSKTNCKMLIIPKMKKKIDKKKCPKSNREILIMTDFS